MKRGLSQPSDPHTVVGEGVALSHVVGYPNGLLVWHLCTYEGGWVATGSRLHTVTDADDFSKVSFHPSLFWSDCCGLHGWIKEGRWSSV